MFTAICYDECGTEVSIEVEDLSQIPRGMEVPIFPETY
jgi:hypothetical protein